MRLKTMKLKKITLCDGFTSSEHLLIGIGGQNNNEDKMIFSKDFCSVGQFDVDLQVCGFLDAIINEGSVVSTGDKGNTFPISEMMNIINKEIINTPSNDLCLIYYTQSRYVSDGTKE